MVSSELVKFLKENNIIVCVTYNHFSSKMEKGTIDYINDDGFVLRRNNADRIPILYKYIVTVYFPGSNTKLMDLIIR